MKRTLRVTLIAALCLALALMAVGCSQQGASVVGRWTLINLSDADGNQVAGTDIENTFGYVVIYEFQEDGTLVTSLGDQSVEGTWTQDGDKVTISLEGQEGSGEIVEDTLTLEYADSVSEFERS